MAAAFATGVVAVPGSSWAAVVLTKARARAAAVQVASETCAATPWCRGSTVEPTRLCARRSPRRVACQIRFYDADGRSSGGIVDVICTRKGHLEMGAAVPSEPGVAQATAAPWSSRDPTAPR